MWDNARLEEETNEGHEDQDENEWAWVTRDQAAQVFNNVEVVEAKCDVAEEDPERVKVDKDCPEPYAAYKFWIHIKESSTETAKKANNKRVNFSSDASDEQAFQFARAMMPKCTMTGKIVRRHLRKHHRRQPTLQLERL